MPLSTRPSPKSLFSYGLPLDELLARIMEQSVTARDDNCGSVVAWSSRPPTAQSHMRVISDVTDRRVILKHPAFALRARVSREEANCASGFSPIKIAITLYADGFTVTYAAAKCCLLVFGMHDESVFVMTES
eukprot:6200138-Pleurochrysis_carterae.AAC.1